MGEWMLHPINKATPPFIEVPRPIIQAARTLIKVLCPLIWMPHPLNSVPHPLDWTARPLIILLHPLNKVEHFNFVFWLMFGLGLACGGGSAGRDGREWGENPRFGSGCGNHAGS